jgi:hypothetical protein
MTIQGPEARPTIIRTTITVALLLCATLLTAGAQQPGKVHRIGFLSYFGCEKSLAPDGAFRQGLRAFGYVETQ